MDRKFSYLLRRHLPNVLVKYLSRYRRLCLVIRDFHGRHKRECPICGYRGYFIAVGVPLRFDAACRQCGSVERHRLHHIVEQAHPEWINEADVLHFGAEPCFLESYKRRAARYVTADLLPTATEVRADIQSLEFSDESFDTIICHHILEHIPDDGSAIRELSRVVRKSGRVIITVPIVESWQDTFNLKESASKQSRDLFHGQTDHLRYYGADFRQRLMSAGFLLTEHVAHEPQVSKYSLIRGETLFVAKKV
ncbi:class I SAM-dependent methyltransferase [Rhizobium sp. Rhizsp82]|uniref:class I SAM-dependent methyltransferase n=1 Tax=Rhizobium sp. Rhizsp82 TaxID=3243057 RepID=UPI0039B40CAB